MPLLLFFIFFIFELWLLIQVGGAIGALPAIFLLFMAGILGVALLRHQGLSTLLRANERMRQGEVPATEMGEGLFLAMGGLLLLIPGFASDVIALPFLIPPFRRFIIRRALHRMVTVRYGQHPGGGAGPGNADPFRPERGPLERQDRPGESSRRSSETIEGEYRRDD